MKITRTLFALSFALTFAGVAAQAQTPNDVQDFRSHGIHVILRSTKANEVIGVVLGFEGGLAYNETDNATIAGMTSELITESGSDKYPKQAYRDSLASLSTSIAGSGSIYHMTYAMRTVRPNFNMAWNIFSDLLLHPHYDTLEAQKISEQTMKAIESRQSDPEGYSVFLSDSIWKGNSRLNRVPTMDEVQHLEIPDLHSYRDAQFQRSRIVLVVVGNVSRAELEEKLAAFEAMPAGDFAWPKVEKIVPRTDQFKFVPRELPTTYVEMRTNSATVADNDWWAERVLDEIMDKRLFDEVRTKRNLSYSPEIYPNGSYANFNTRIALQSILPDSAAHVVFTEIRKIQNNTVSPDDLEHAKEGRITTYYYATQKNLSQAQALYTDQVEGGDWHLFFQIVPKTEQVTAAQVRDVADRYFHHFNFVLMGPEGKSNRDQYHFE
jgi:zinc protease